MTPNKIREGITKKLIEDMECKSLHYIPWRRPWNFGAGTGMPMNFTSHRPYTGINSLILMAERYESSLWGSKSAWSKAGARPRKGEKPTTIVGMGMLPSKDKSGKIRKDVTGKDVWFTIAKRWKVFNVFQLAPKRGCSMEKYMPQIDIHNMEPDFAPAESLISDTGAKIYHRGQKAAYRRKADMILIPSKRAFDSMSDYYETVFHELCHWCEHDERVGRPEEYPYAFGELVAEIGACFLLAHLHVPLAYEMIDKSKSYLAHWLQEMGNDSKYIFDAASRASKVADYILSCKKGAVNVAA